MLNPVDTFRERSRKFISSVEGDKLYLRANLAELIGVYGLEHTRLLTRGVRGEIDGESFKLELQALCHKYVLEIEKLLESALQSG